MKISCHGGKCCGVKHIHGFTAKPNYNGGEGYMLGPISNDEDSQPHDLSGGGYTPNRDWFVGEAPRENEVDRLARLIAYIDQTRPSNLVEIILSHNTGMAEAWRPILEGHGFREVSRFKNSNTSQTLVVFHRTTPLENKEKK